MTRPSDSIAGADSTVRLNSDGGRRAGWVMLMALIANQQIMVMVQAEYGFLRFVIHAGLAKIVSGCGIATRRLILERDHTGGYFCKFVLGLVFKLLFKVSDSAFHLAFAVGQRVILLGGIKQALLELDRGVLNLDDSVVKFLERSAYFRIIERLYRTRHNINSSF